jgi:hypothetical protein
VGFYHAIECTSTAKAMNKLPVLYKNGMTLQADSYMIYSRSDDGIESLSFIEKLI